MNYSIEIMGIATPHEPDFMIQRLPFQVDSVKARGGYRLVLLCFASPAEVLTQGGMCVAEAGDCMIITPVFPEIHRSCVGSKGFVNDWLHVNVQNPAQLEAMDLPVNQLIHSGNALFIRAHLEALQTELNLQKKFYELAVNHLIEAILIDLARVFEECRDAGTAGSVYTDQLLELKKNLESNLTVDWTVAKMARWMGLSTCRFSVLYRRQFKRSPLDDLIQLRIQEAKKMLKTSNLPLKEIARQCGFRNEFYLSRVFKRKVGIPPSGYRQQ